MFTQYFGQYLLNNGMVTPEQLYQALEAQQAAHVKLGVLAMSAGVLTPVQVEEIHREQTRQDKRFGEIALEKGYLNQEQLDNLLSSQKQGHLLLGQALIDGKILNLNQLGRALRQYQEEYRLSDEQFAAVQGGDYNLLLAKTLDLSDGVLLDYLSLFAKNMMRFIDPRVWISAGDHTAEKIGEWSAVQKITGPVAMTTAIAGSAQALAQLASRFAREEILDLDELGQASVAEFLNLHNGLFLVNMSNQGVELQLEPQSIYPTGVNLTGECQVFKVHMEQGDFYLVLQKSE